ncbi:MAG: hypothetical protein MJZ05_11755 [Fibrobacter sp.]|nr:hypothetical protein [Fibrobacter sp.]
MKTLFLILCINICVFANRNAFLPITKIHVESTANDSMAFDLNFDKGFKAVNASIYAFNKQYSLSKEELQVFDQLPLVNYCVFETASSNLSLEFSQKLNSCIKKQNNCSSLKTGTSSSKKILYIKCGNGNEDAVYMQFDSNGKFDIEH